MTGLPFQLDGGHCFYSYFIYFFQKGKWDLLAFKELELEQKPNSLAYKFSLSAFNLAKLEPFA